MNPGFPVRLERRRREVVDTPVELLVSYTNQSFFVARRAVRIRVIVYVLEDLDGVAQIVTIRIIAIEVILPEADCKIKIDMRQSRHDIGRRDRFFVHIFLCIRDDANQETLRLVIMILFHENF